MDENKVLFRNKGRGYNKDDVNDYIAAENKRFADAEAAFKRTIQEKDRVIEGFSNELYKCNNEIYVLKNSIAEKDKDIEELKAKIEESDKTVAELRVKVAELEEKLAKAEEAAAKQTVPVPAPAPVPTPAPVYAPVQPEVNAAPAVERHTEPQTETSIVSVSEIIPETNSIPEQEIIITPEPETVPAPEVVPEPVNEPTVSADKEPRDDADAGSDDELAEIYKKAEAYDCICDQIDEILEHAKKEADNIINTAHEAARKIRSSRNEIDSMKREISGRSSGIIGEIKKSVVTKRR